MADDIEEKHYEIMHEAAKNPRPSSAWGIEMKILVGLSCATLLALWSYAHFLT